MDISASKSQNILRKASFTWKFSTGSCKKTVFFIFKLENQFLSITYRRKVYVCGEIAPTKDFLQKFVQSYYDQLMKPLNCPYLKYVLAWNSVLCESWTSSPNELFLERNASATICSWIVRHVTALIVFHYFIFVNTTMCKQQSYWNLMCHLSILDVLLRLLVFSYYIYIYIHICMYIYIYIIYIYVFMFIYIYIYIYINIWINKYINIWIYINI